MKRLGMWVAVGGLVFLLSGCETLRLYNKEADTAATSAKTDYDASKVAEALKGEGAMLDGLEAKELDAHRKATQAERNFQLLSLLSESGSSAPRTTSDGVVPRFRDFADKRLLALLGTVTDPLPILKQLDLDKRVLRDAEIQEKQARGQLPSFNAKLAALPACNKDVAALKDKSANEAAALIKDDSFDPSTIQGSSTWKTAIQNLGTTCGKLLAARDALADSLKKFSTGQVSTAFADAQTQQAALTSAQDKAKAAATEMKNAAAKLAAALKAAKDVSEVEDLTCELSKPATDAKTDAGKKKNEFCETLKKLNGLGDFGIKVLSEERLARINAVLAAMSGIEPGADAPPLEPSLALLSASSRFGQALKKYQAALTLPALEPLLIERQLATAQQTYAQGGVELQKARVRYAQEYLDASLQEADLLLRAKAELGGVGVTPAADTACEKAKPVFCASMNQLLTDKAFSDPKVWPGEKPGRQAYRALAFLSESYSVARDRQRTAEVKLIDTNYRDSLLRSEASVAAWNAVVSVPVDQLAALHKAGWTPAEIAQLLQSFGVVGVAARLK